MLILTYESMEEQIRFLEITIPPSLFEHTSIGKTPDNRELHCIRFGPADAASSYLLTASIHGREYINTALLMEFAWHLSTVIEQLEKFKTRILLLPMANPDGVSISQYGAKGIRDARLRENIDRMLKRHSHKKWKANALGIDCNRNFTSGFHPAGSPGAKFYSGEVPGEAPETRSLMDYVDGLTGLHAVIHYHSRGNLIYWDYPVSGVLRYHIRNLAETASTLTGYRKVTASKDTKPSGGFGEWCVFSQKIPSITFETGRFFCPVPLRQFPEIRKRNLPFLETLIKGEI